MILLLPFYSGGASWLQRDAAPYRARPPSGLAGLDSGNIMINLNLKRLRESHEGKWFLVDVFMLLLLVVNLLLLIADGLYSIDAVRQWLTDYAPKLAVIYQPIHANFILIDLCFVALFLTEFFVRWSVSVRHKTYLRWYFYPFIHWYDLIGCIPLGATRIFRFLRVFSIVYRLQKFGIIDLRETSLYRFVWFYYEVLIEELTDRVILKSLSDVQDELEGNSQIVDDVLQQVVYKRKETLANWASLSMAHVGNSIERNKDGIVTQHLINSVSDAMINNDEVARLRSIPVIGKSLEGRLERGVADIVVSTIVNLLNEMSTEKMLHLLERSQLERSGLSDSAQRGEINMEMRRMLDDCIEVIKEHVSKKKWKTALADNVAAASPPRPGNPAGIG
jgi:hypothetical protein